jgi:hypothetical protein
MTQPLTQATAAAIKLDVAVDAETLMHLASLPLSKIRHADNWSPTRISPCPALMLCCGCSRYKPIGEFYILRDNRKPRKDIFGARRANTCSSCAIKAYISLDPRKKLFYSARQRANLKGYEFSITLDDVVIPEYCPVLGIKLEGSVGHGRKNLNQLEASPSLDRIDNTRGYVPGNVCVISLRANNLKKDATLAELRALTRYMEEFSATDSTATTTALEVLR